MVPRILIVDDDPDMVELLRCGLTDAGYSAREAGTGKEALQRAKRSLPDLVVLDLLLPDMNGFSVCQQLRQNPATAAIPILMITVLPGQFPRLVGVEAGANAYLNKPFRMEDLVSCVGDLLRQPGVASEVLAAPPVSSGTEAFPAFPVAPSGSSRCLFPGARV
jgi:DNA-binding response OmpR family regulator